ncbi:MAG: hypothetical protein ACR2HZ_04815 [Gemmatimonadaceae bacterium]
MIVDASVVTVENFVRRLGHAGRTTPDQRRDIIRRAAFEVARLIVFGVFMIITVSTRAAGAGRKRRLTAGLITSRAALHQLLDVIAAARVVGNALPRPWRRRPCVAEGDALRVE